MSMEFGGERLLNLYTMKLNSYPDDEYFDNKACQMYLDKVKIKYYVEYLRKKLKSARRAERWSI